MKDFEDLRECGLMSGREVKRKLPIQMLLWMLALPVGMGLGPRAWPCAAVALAGQQQGENPFPGQAVKAPSPAPSQAPQAAKPSDGPSGGAAAKPAEGGDNPFPGETTDAPILPVEPEVKPAPKGTSEFADGGRASTDQDGDPVKSPDLAGGAEVDDGFSSSRSGLGRLPMEDTTEASNGKAGKQKTREQLLKENVDVGNFYLDRKNWRAAETRFEDAFALNQESPEAVLGLAVAEQHLQMYEKAREHFALFLNYDPEGPHSRAARKGLEQVEAALAISGGKPKALAGDGMPPK